MRVIVKCLTCDEVLGNIEKADVSDDDLSFYRQMVTCSNGHIAEAIDFAEEDE
jgi:hypothetical protein